jgi:hypothetical protein
MATTLTLNAKYPDWTQEDRDRFNWINSWDRRRRNLARLLPCKRCGTAAVFKENHADMPYHNIFKLGCPRCHQYLETTTDLSPVQFLDGCTLRSYKIGCHCIWCGSGTFTTLPRYNGRGRSFISPDCSSQKVKRHQRIAIRD